MSKIVLSLYMVISCYLCMLFIVYSLYEFHNKINKNENK